VALLSRVVAVAGAGPAVLLLLGCGIVHVSHNTRYFATERDAGGTIQLHRGDEVTLNLVISNGRDWTAVSGDVHVAEPKTTEVRNFTNGQKARLFDFALVGRGRTQLVACPAGTKPCSPSSSGALTFEVDVT
jgi:hypothetical protein